MATPDFIATRLEGEAPNEIPKTSEADGTVSNVSEDTVVTAEIVDGGSKRGGQKLVTSDGYAYVKKRILVKGDVDWKCTVRSCPAIIKQSTNSEVTTRGQHSHDPKPGILNAVKLKAELKAVAKQHVFEAASALVREVSNRHPQQDQPDGTRLTPSVESLIKMCNTSRKSLRPVKPDETKDDTPHVDDSVEEDSPVTYEIVDGGSARGEQKLVSSDGYAYVKKRASANGDVVWKCSVRKCPCPATVKQISSEFTTRKKHNHQPKPGILTAVKIKAELKGVAREHVFEAASALVKEVTCRHQQGDQPDGSQPSLQSLIKMCNRTRRHLRPVEVTSNDFHESMSSDFHEPMSSNFLVPMSSNLQCGMDIVGVRLIVDVESAETTNIGVCLIPQGQIHNLTLKELKDIIRKDILACPQSFNFCTAQRWQLTEEQENKLSATQVLVNNNELFIKATRDGPKCGIKNRHGNVIGFVHIEYSTKLATLKSLIYNQILNCENSSSSFHFLDGNSWPISSIQEDHMTVSDILIGHCVTIDVQSKRQLTSEQLTPPKEPPAKKLKGPNELSFRSGKDVCRQLSSDCSDGGTTAKQILISYVRSEAADHALLLKQQLISHGLSVYLDVHEIQTGVDWQDSLNFAVSGCEVFVPLVTRKYGETQWTNREVKLADVLGKYMLPVNFLPDWPPRCLAIQFATTQYIPWMMADPSLLSTTPDISHWKDEDIKLVARKISDRITGLGMTSVPSLIKRSTIVKSCALVTEDNMLAVTSNRDGKPLVMICVHPLQETFGYELQQMLEKEDYEVWCTTELDREHVDHIDGLANSQDDITYSVLNNGCTMSMAPGCHDDSILQNIQLFQEKADDASVVLFVLSENFSSSRVCQQQVFYCEHRKRVVPILYEDFQMPHWMTMLVGSHGFEMRKDEDFIKILSRRVKAAVVPNLSSSNGGISPVKLTPSPVNKTNKTSTSVNKTVILSNKTTANKTSANTTPTSNGSKFSVVNQNSGKFTPSDHTESNKSSEGEILVATPLKNTLGPISDITLTGSQISPKSVMKVTLTGSQISSNGDQRRTSPSKKSVDTTDARPNLSKMKTLILSPDH